MNLILLFPEDFVQGTSRARLEGRRFRHIREIHRATVGEELCVGLVGNRIGRGRILQLDDSSLEMEVELRQAPPMPLPIILILALPRPLVLKRTLIAATSLGVKRIFLMNANRVERSFWTSKTMDADNLREQLILGLEQARDTELPELQLRPYFRPFVEEELPRLSKDTLRIIAHPEASVPCPHRVEGPVTLTIGPEGGFVPYEIDRLEAVGFTAVHLGSRILRVETVIPALLSRLFV